MAPSAAAMKTIDDHDRLGGSERRAGPCLGLVLVAALAAGCTGRRAAGPLPSDPIIDWNQVPLTPRKTVLREPSDEEIATAAHVLLRGRLADLAGNCAKGRQLLEAASRIAPGPLLDEALGEHERRCLGASPDPAAPALAIGPR